MSFTYENQGSNTYLVYRFQEDEQIDHVGLGMITNNHITGLAQAAFMQLDKDKFIRYNVTSKVVASQVFLGVVDKKIVLGVLNGIADAFLAADDYMIDGSNILFDMDNIYVNVSTGETVLIYLPVERKNPLDVNVENIVRNIIFNSQFNPNENCDYVVKIITFINSCKKINFNEFKELLNTIHADTASQPQPPRETPMPQSAAPANFAKPVQQPAMTPTTGSYETPQPAPAAKMPGSGIPQGRAAVQMPTPASAPIPAQEIVLPPKPDNGGSLADKENISLFSLMAHYSKENKELYDYQKTVKKMQKQAGKQSSAACAKPKASKKQQAAPNPGFAVPNQPNPGFAIPNQAPSSSMPQQAPMQSIPQPQQMQPMAQQTPVQQQSQKLPQQPKPAGNANGVNPSVPPQVLARMTTGANFGETTVLGVGMEAGETTVLGAAQAQMVNPYLLRAKNNERITLNKPVFRIGKEKSYVDYFIGDNTAVSRSHANIVNKNNEFYIVDTNSTNHTYVDNVMVQSNVETRIEHGAKIRLANEEFTFYMY